MSWTTTTMASARMAPTASARDDDRTRVATRQATPVAPEDAGSSDDHVTEVKHSLGFILNLASASTLETEPSKDTMGFSTATMDAHQQAAHADSSSGTDSSTGKAAGKSNSKPKRTKKVGKAKAAMSHAEKRLARKCSVEDCMNYTINKGLCFRHGGGKQCTMDGCKASAKIAGLCWKHGGSVPCVVDGCERRGKSRGLCWAHGGGTKCQADACSKVAVSNGFCWAHGGGKRCQFDGCQRPAYERTLNFCPTHFKRFENGEEVLEL